MKMFFKTLKQWFISGESVDHPVEAFSKKIDWLRVLPFLFIHLGCLMVFFVGFSWAACCTALVLYWVRGISITAFYHRYFSHRAYKTSRISQFIFALIGATAVQKGPLWWASHHRHHHRYADQPEDPHSPVAHGFFWSHIGWILSKRNFHYIRELVKDLIQYPELVLLDRYYVFVPIILGVMIFSFGVFLQHVAPSWGTNGWQMLVWGFFISTTALFHTTSLINSVAHQVGKQPYDTKDHSRNNFWFAFFTWGEGWHNNHHYYPASARLGFHPGELDISFYLLKLLEKMGIIWDLRYPPKEIL